MAKKSPAALSSDHAYVVNPAQLGGIDLLSQIDGPAAGTRCAWVNTWSGLHYKVLVDRGLDIAEAFYKGMSLSWLSLSGAPRPEMAMHRGLDWLWGFFGGLVASCGPSSAGAPCKDGTEELGLHGRHTNLSASLESVVGPDPLRGLTEMSITGVVRQAKLFEPNLELRRTITSPLGRSRIIIEDTFINRGNLDAPHAWLLHMNFGYPLLEPGSQFLFAGKTTPIGEHAAAHFKKRNLRVVPEPLDEHRGTGEACVYIDPDTDRAGNVCCGVLNPKRKFGVKLTFLKKHFPRVVNWQHFGPNGQYVMGIEPANCGVEGRNVDRQRGWLDVLRPGQVREYKIAIDVVEGPAEIAEFKKAVGGK